MSERIVFYVATRNFYHLLSLSLASLLKHTRIDRIYLLIEDDTFPYDLPDNVTIVNVSEQSYFSHDGPNYHSMFSHIIMLRTVLPLMFPDIHKALSIDADTLVLDDISTLWDVDLADSYFAAVPELTQIHGKLYFNIGIAMLDFDRLRIDRIPERAVTMLNTTRYRWPEQDVFNDLCKGHITPLPAKYNYAPGVTAWNIPHVIRHYIGVGTKDWMILDAKGGHT